MVGWLQRLFGRGRAQELQTGRRAGKIQRIDPPPDVSWERNLAAQRALNVLRTTQDSVFLTGSAGTGKTTLLQTWCRESRPVVLAPTGIAALQAGGQTIHSFFGFKPKLLRPSDVRKMAPPLGTPLNRLSTVVIDEVSMVRADLMGAVEARLREYGPRRGASFGGVRILLVGDLLQLPPVVDSGLEDYFSENRTKLGYASPWWFEPSALKHCPDHVVELLQPYRQVDESFVSLLQRVRFGKLSTADEDWLHERVRNTSDDTIRLTATKQRAYRWNEARLEQLSSPGRLYTASFSGDQSELMNARWPAPDKLRLKSGARVVIVRNDAEAKRWVNGDTGTIVSLGSASVKVRFDRDPQPIHEVGPVTWEILRYSYEDSVADWVQHVVASFTQIPLDLGWARTIHKAQGQTYESAHIDLGNGAFSPGMAYVAISRVRSLEKLTFEQPLRKSDVWADQRAITWMRSRVQTVCAD